MNEASNRKTGKQGERTKEIESLQKVRKKEAKKRSEGD